MEELPDDTSRARRARALAAIGALAGFGGLVVVILAVGAAGEKERELAAAPAECLGAWNGDRKAVSTGVHNAAAHGYTRAQVAYAGSDAAELSADPVEGGGCIVVFAAQSLDPEPVAAGEIEIDGRWEPLSAELDLDRLAELQRDALAEANAQLRPDGRVRALES